MSIPPINPAGIAQAAQATPVAQPRTSPAAERGSLTEMVGQAIGELNESLNVADELAMRLAAGEEVDLHEVMIGLEMAGIGLQTAVQIRNRVIEAYKEIMAMPV